MEKDREPEQDRSSVLLLHPPVASTASHRNLGWGEGLANGCAAALPGWLVGKLLQRARLLCWSSNWTLTHFQRILSIGRDPWRSQYERGDDRFVDALCSAFPGPCTEKPRDCRRFWVRKLFLLFYVNKPLISFFTMNVFKN